MSPLGEHERAAIREVFADLERDVPLLLELGPEEAPVTVLAGGREIDFGEETRKLLEQLSDLSDRVGLTVRETDIPGQWPKTSVADALVYHGLPWGYELTTLVGAIAEAGRTTTSLTPGSVVALAALERDVALEVFVTPT
jgi:alkyl hydroperoxide reductase subunit AhpF